MMLQIHLINLMNLYLILMVFPLSILKEYLLLMHLVEKNIIYWIFYLL
jgi:hypothetical protein